MPAPRRPSPTHNNGNAHKRARLVPDASQAISIDDTSDVEIVEVINISDTEVESVPPTAPRRDAVDPNHVAQKNLYFAVVRGMVRGECWSGVTSCATCAYSAIRFAPKGASSYVVPVRRQKEAYTIVEEESISAQISAHDQRSVDPELLDVIVYTDGSFIDATSNMVQKVWMSIANEERTAYSGYGVFFAQDCAFNACGPVPGAQNVKRSELYAVCIALETVVENITWAGRVLVRTDATLQNIPMMSRTHAKDQYKSVENADVWKRIEASLCKLEDRNVVVIFEWVKSHAMSWGNYSADRLAKAGKLFHFHRCSVLFSNTI